MQFTDYLNATCNTLEGAVSMTQKMGTWLFKSAGIWKPEKAPEIRLHRDLENLDVTKFVNCGSLPVKVAAFSGAMAVVLGAYGAHTLNPKGNYDKGNYDEGKYDEGKYDERKLVYETANRYHFFHTLALLGAPMSRNPKITTSLMGLGILLFCGPCYYQALTDDGTLRKLTPIGGTFLILGWLSLAL